MNKIDFNSLRARFNGGQSPVRWKQQGFVMLPNRLVFDGRAKMGELLVFWILTLHLFKGKNYCYPSTRKIQEETRLSRPTIIKAIKNLSEWGYLETEKTKGKVTKYFLKIRV